MTLRIGWVGFHLEGVAALEALLQAQAPVAAVITLTPEAVAARSAAADYDALCRRYGAPLHRVANINDAAAITLLTGLAVDVLFVIGWSQVLGPAALRTARVGVVGAHASLLPKNRGSAPINWALINGERRGGNSLIWLTEQVDAGAVIDQTAFSITSFDTCATLYQRVAESNRDMILRLLPRLQAGERPGQRQPPGHDALLPRRKPADGLINWANANRSVYDFVRALTRPYPGAFSWLEARRWRVWQAALLPDLDGRDAPAMARPGQVLGPVISPIDAACGQVVACGAGAVLLLELEMDSGEVLGGRQLADQPWTGKVWTNA